MAAINSKSLTKKYGVKHPQNETNDSQNEKTKFIMAIVAVIACMVLVIIAWNMGKKHIALEDYVELSYTEMPLLTSLSAKA